MTQPSESGAVLLVGCGRLGSAILEGWLATGTVAPGDLIILTPSEKPAAEAARALGARVNPSTDALTDARAVVLAVKPGKWREAVAPLLERLPGDAVIVSVMAGVSASGIAGVAGRRVARVMPTTGVAQARGVAALWSGDSEAREIARGLFGPIGDVVDLEDEALMDAATAVAGSAPAFIHAFVQALARAGERQGLSAQAAERLARGALRSAGAGVEAGQSLEALIGRVASPGGTTRAGLDAMQATGGLERAAEAAVEAAVQRARTISG
ncbi:pyrroline-5-carboxylate reductase family protein [Brevundimonas sp.]|uniref:pyrroline-5-carboxylate reductase family protein n=1 Tax=Brevundimonas sp. TaxID=1871086 RepID=UPI002D58B640|nr:pyrroline-5-carboxylate reductase dimerization domain-containing protein [Brevundimonas sp.]HYC69236.1 pyrroline-5-carboxylate reductase dimerization domain-containing protein [Brevundimonas sp.]